MADEKDPIEQPIEDSDEGQPIDSPDNAEEGGEQLEEDSLVEINGEKVSLEELKNGYLRQSDYTKKTQTVQEERKQLKALQERLLKTPNKELTTDEKNVQDFIKQYGVITKDQLDEKLKMQSLRDKDMQEYNSWKTSSGVDSDVADAVLQLGKAYQDISYDQIFKKYFKGKSNIVSKKTVGISSKKTVSDTPGGVITKAQIQKWIDNGEYGEHRDKIMLAVKEGRIKS